MVPTRGQIIAAEVTFPSTRSISPLKEGSWANGGDEYWFPRPNSTSTSGTIILGGGRKSVAQDEQNVIDDSVVNPIVGQILRAFLPRTFSGIEMKVKVMMEWVSVSCLFIGTILSMFGRLALWASQQPVTRW